LTIVWKHQNRQRSLGETNSFFRSEERESCQNSFFGWEKWKPEKLVLVERRIWQMLNWDKIWIILKEFWTFKVRHWSFCKRPVPLVVEQGQKQRTDWFVVVNISTEIHKREARSCSCRCAWSAATQLTQELSAIFFTCGATTGTRLTPAGEFTPDTVLSVDAESSSGGVEPSQLVLERVAPVSTSGRVLSAGSEHLNVELWFLLVRNADGSNAKVWS
jgi:hypothetical protein